MTNYPFIQRFSKSFGFLNIENQAIKFINNQEIKILMLKDKEYKECAAEYQKESERLEQEALLGKGGNKGRSPSHVSKDGKSKIITRQEPEKPTYVMGQSSNQYCPDFSENSNSNDDDVFWKEGLTGLLDTEAIVILKWLNKFVCKKPFLLEKFPKCIFDSYGDIIVDFIEQISGRKIPGVKAGPGEEPAVRRGDNKDGTNASRPTNRLSARIAASLRLSAKFSLILSHLISGGALLNHINAIDLLKLEDHMLAQEVDLRKCEGDRMTPASLEESKVLWERSWKANCTFGWTEVLFQALKIYTISRCTFKDYQQLPGVVTLGDVESPVRTDNTNLPAPPSKNGVAVSKPKSKKGSPGPVIPIALTNSNVYSIQESVLLSWATLHAQKAILLKKGGKAVESDYGVVQEIDEEKNFEGDSEEKNQGPGSWTSSSKQPLRIVDIHSYFKTYSGFCQVFHSHKPDFGRVGGPLYGYNTVENTHANFKRFKDALDKVYLSIDVTAEQMACSSRSLLLLLAHLYLNLPSLLPKVRQCLLSNVYRTLLA